MRLVHTYVAELLIEDIKDDDSVAMLEHLHANISKNEGPPSGQHWLSGVGEPKPFNSASPCCFTISSRPGFRDRIGVIADQLIRVGHALFVVPREAQPVQSLDQARCRRLEARPIWVTPSAGEIRDVRSVLRTGWSNRRRHVLP
jgi:hypothetical protein